MISTEIDTNNKNLTGFNTPKITFRRILGYTLITLGGVVMLAYVIFQARFLIQGPLIVLDNEPSAVENTKTVTISGTARNIAKITLNDRQIFTDKTGYFSEALVLENGYTIATIKAVDRYGREKQVVRSFVYTPTSLVPEPQ